MADTDIADGLSMYTEALVQVMRRQPRREPPHAVAMEILEEVVAEYQVSPEFKAYLHAWAHHRAGFVDAGDWRHDRLFAYTTDARHLGDGQRALHIGTTGGGDDYVARLGGPTEAIVCCLHDDLHEQPPTDFEGFLEELVFQAHDGGNATDLDELLGMEPY